MKVGTDGVLLGAWTDCRNDDRNVLDVGAGTGVIALIVAQNYSESGVPCKIKAIDIDADAVEEAEGNFAASPWSGNLSCEHITLQKLASDRAYESFFDLIVSNPPFFENSLKAPDNQRSLARHNDSLPFSDLFSCAKILLKDEGRLSVILPYDALPQIRAIVVALRLKISRIETVRTTVRKEPKRVLMEFVKTERAVQTKNSELIIQSAGNYTEEYIYLTSGLYPKF